ncbi:hypothetical protein MtrunA17_Chr3g0094151 [Medicago truncatula]|nr:hypothetical protein MtrunA17_Chr3g0094151 [Medicago truncatula]
MDNSSFLKILEFKDWFSRYDFTVKHIKVNQNLIPDLLSRPMKPVQIITNTHTFPLILMVKPLPAHASIIKNFPPGINFSCSLSQLKEYARNNLFYFMAKIIKKIKNIPEQSPFLPDTPFYLPFMLNPNAKFTENHLWYIWCAAILYIMPIFVPTEAMCQHLMNPKNHKSLIWTALEWYSPLEWWRIQLGPVLSEVRKRGMAPEAIGKLKTVLTVHRPYQIDPRTKFLICKNYADIWETIDDYPPSLKVTKDLMDYINFTNLHHREKTQIDTTCISHGNLPPQFKPVNPQEIGESSRQASQPEQDFQENIEQQFTQMNFEENPTDIEPLENLDEETIKQLIADSWQYESCQSRSYFSEDCYYSSSDPNMSPSHESIFKD